MGLLLNAHGAGPDEASAWVRRWSHLVPPGARVLDVACGGGRHVRWFAARGAQVTGIDRDAGALAPLAGIARTLAADLEGGPWPLAEEERFDAVVVTNYLHRPLLARLPRCLADGGVLIYETFANGQQTVARPSNPDFLLRPGELLAACAGLRIVAYEDGFDEPPPRYVQRIVAARETGDASAFARHRLRPVESPRPGG